METQILIDKITKAIAFAFRTDGTVPGLTIAWLAHNQSYYVSVIRWIEGEKEVACSAQNAELNTALQDLAVKFLLEREPNPIDMLAEILHQQVLKAA